MGSRSRQLSRPTFRRRALALLGLTLAGLGNLPALASSPQAWEAYGRQVLKACSAVSGLRNPRPAGERVMVPNASGIPTSVLLLRGTYPQPHMAGKTGLEICLFDATSGKARVADADRLISPPAAPPGSIPRSTQ